jgi:hypothetical protein
MSIARDSQIIMHSNQDSQTRSVLDTPFDHAAGDRRCSTSGSDRRPIEPNWISDDSIPAPIRVLQLATGRWVAHMVGVAAELGLADLVQTGPKTAEQLADAAGLHAPSLYRLLRSLAGVGVFAKQEDGRFAQTPMSDALRSDVSYSMRGLARMVNRPWTIGAWTNLEHSVRTGISAFEEANGIGLFDYFAQHAVEMQIFAQAMSGFSAQIGTAVADAYDFFGIKTLADIGGSHGMVLALILARNPEMRGILFDLPEVIEGSSDFFKNRGMHQRVELKSGNFFESVPEGADAYLLKHVLHDWSDQNCLRILKNIHAVTSSATKLLVVEFILNESNEPQFAKVADLEMLVNSPDGKERTRVQWQNLLRAGGFRLTRAIPTNSGVYLIEAVRY